MTPGTLPHWLEDATLILETGWTEQQCDGTSPETKRRLITLIRARNRAQDQMNRKANSRRPK